MIDVVLRGFVEDMASKCGLRFVRFCAIEPYHHMVTIEVEGDDGREDDSSLTEDLWPFCRGMVEVAARLENGDLYARPSSFSVRPSPDRSPTKGESANSSNL